jgi:hypothetical protein
LDKYTKDEIMKNSSQENRAKIENLVLKLQAIGINYKRDEWTTSFGFPGLQINEGMLVYNPGKASLDALLHEAGHIAVCSTRHLLTGWNTTQESDEYAAIAWSYCMGLEFGVPVEEIFANQFSSLDKIAIPSALERKEYKGIGKLLELKMLDTISAFPVLNRYLVQQL